MFTLTQHYTVLGVGPSATLKEVKSAYIRLARQCHPDKMRQPSPTANSFVAIRNAYEAINADLIRRQAEESQRKRLSNLNSRLDALMNLLDESDVSSDSEDMNDCLFDTRMKMMDEQYKSLQDILNSRTSSERAMSAKQKTKMDSAWRDDVVDTDTSEKSFKQESVKSSSMLIEEESKRSMPQLFCSAQSSPVYCVIRL